MPLIAQSFSDPPEPLCRFTVDDYHRMIEAGVLTEDDPVEFLEGWLVVKVVRGSVHDTVIGLINKALGIRLPSACHVRVQMAITTGDSEPEPDLAVVWGAIRDFIDRHPGPDDTALVIEVADSTLERDREIKGRIYANAGIPEYWIVNLTDSTVEVYSEPLRGAPTPSYGNVRSYHAGDFIPLRFKGQFADPIDCREILP